MLRIKVIPARQSDFVKFHLKRYFGLSNLECAERSAKDLILNDDYGFDGGTARIVYLADYDATGRNDDYTGAGLPHAAQKEGRNR